MFKVANSGSDLRKVALDVLSGNVAILKNAVDPNLVRRAVASTHEWAKNAPQSKGHPRDAGGSTHLVSYLPPRSESRYIVHDFLFDPNAGDEIGAAVMPVFDVLLSIHCSMLGRPVTWEATDDGFAFLPQIIQYPRGGGFFQEHFHEVEPQRIGMVLAGSQLGVDHDCGGGRFRAPDGSWLSTEGKQDVGDVALFRYDVGHDVTPVDPDRALDWTREDGRWSFVLPLKPRR